MMSTLGLLSLAVGGLCAAACVAVASESDEDSKLMLPLGFLSAVSLVLRAPWFSLFLRH